MNTRSFPDAGANSCTQVQQLKKYFVFAQLHFTGKLTEEGAVFGERVTSLRQFMDYFCCFGGTQKQKDTMLGVQVGFSALIFCNKRSVQTVIRLCVKFHVGLMSATN